MNAIQKLKHEHERLQHICSLILAHSKKDKHIDELLAQLQQELTAHAKAEEKLIYPELKEHKESKSNFYEANEEHHLVEQLLKELNEMKPHTPEWLAKLKVLRENLHHHIEEEEKEIFPKIEKFLTKNELNDIGEKIEEVEKKLAKKH